MKFLSGFCALLVLLLSQPSFSQDSTSIINPSGVLSNSLTPAEIQNLINTKSSQFGVTPSEAQNIANQVMPQLQNGTTQQVIANPQNPSTTAPTKSALTNTAPPDSTHKQTINHTDSDKPKSTIFGQDYFRNQTVSTYNKYSDMQAPDNYIIGVGDKLSINVWGLSSFSNVYTVDETGAILPTQTGKIYVKGLTFKEVQGLVKSRFGSFLNLQSSELEVSLTYSRVITVNIVGEVINPGSYTIPAINTVFNALAAADGPSDMGSLRKIYVKRAGQTVQTLDVYEFLLNPNSKEDYFLHDNDYIFVAPRGRLVSISGEVMRPYRYELTDNENLTALLNYAGGITDKAFKTSIQIERYYDNELKLIDVNLDSLMKGKKDFILLNGDKISINPLPDQVLTWIKINGPVIQPGQFNFIEGQRISDLLAKNPFRKDALLDRAYIIRTNNDYSKKYIAFTPDNILKDKNSPDNLALQNMDVINFFSKSSYADNFTVTSQGAVRNPGEFAYGEGMTLQDVLYYSGGLRPEAANNRIEISRILKTADDKTISPVHVIVQTFQVGKDLSIDKSASDLKLEPYDMVIVRTASDYDKQNNVTINGEVLYPGIYTMENKGERLTSFIQRSGGLTQWAYGEDAKLYRKSEGKGTILMHLDRALKKPNGKYDFIIRPGDEITIPKLTNIVTITGAIRYPYPDTLRQINLAWFKGKRAKYYIKHHGLGFGKEAIRKNTYVINNGQNVKGCHRFLFFNVYPKVEDGATILVPSVPPKIQQLQNSRTPIDWNRTIENVTVKLTGIATLYILLTKIGNL